MLSVILLWAWVYPNEVVVSVPAVRGPSRRWMWDANSLLCRSHSLITAWKTLESCCLPWGICISVRWRQLWYLWAVAENFSSLMLRDKVGTSLTFPIQCSLQNVTWMMPLVTICCSAEYLSWDLVGCDLWHQNLSVCVGVRLAVQGGRCSRASARLVLLVGETQLHPKAAPPMLQQLRPANAELRPQAALV